MNPAFYECTKQAGVDCHFIGEKIENKDIKLEYVHRDEQLADFLTKEASIGKLYAPAW